MVEYDGYYWHVLIENNDSVKNEIAQKNNLMLYRVKENEKREVDFLTEIQKIKVAEKLSSEWEITSPKGEKYTIKNLKTGDQKAASIKEIAAIITNR